MKTLFALVLTLALLTSAALATQLSPVAEGQEASDFEVTLTDGTTFKLSDQRGKAVLVNLWATWCPPCVAEMPDLQKLSEDYADSLVVLGVNVGGDSPEDAAAFMEENGYTYPSYVDVDYSLALGMFPSPYIPFTVVIDPNGVVRTILYYPLSTGRNFEEIKRIILALQKADADACATPADWRPGDDVIVPTAGSCGVAKERMDNQSENQYCLDWFMCFRKEAK